MSDRDERPDSGMTDPAAGASPSEALPPRVPARPPGHVRIEGVEAGLAVGSVGDDDSPTAVDLPEEEPDDAVPEWTVSLPDWRDPPTREIPRILLDHPLSEEPRSMPGPVWREVESDWEHDDLTFADIVGEGSAVPEHAAGPDDADPFAFDFEFDEPTTAVGLTPATASSAVHSSAPPLPSAQTERGEPVEPGAASSDARQGAALSSELARPSSGVTFAGLSRLGRRATAPKHARDGSRRQASDAGTSAVTAPARASVASSSRRDPIVATATGLIVGALVLVCLKAGPAYMLALSTVVVTAAAAECYHAFRLARYEPAVLLGLAAVPVGVVVAYLDGPGAIVVVAAVLVMATLCWYLFGLTKRYPLANMAATIGVWAWVGFLGSFAGLLLSPSLFPDRHGVAYMLGALEATVAYDVGAYAFGSWIGKHHLAPSVSPNKTWEGLIGGSLAAIAVSLALVTHMAPWTVPHALGLGLVVAVFAPLGDFVESMIKRDIGVKDMGTLLPAHGGALDRIDALLFVLPATYFLVVLFHG